MFSQRAYLETVAARTGVPFWVLWGVEGMETDYGRNVSTSSAGAKGAFQFIAETARTFSYPYTNTETQAVYERQADAAGRYLAQLHSEHGGWDAALRAYSGGGYGEAEVKAKALGGGATITAGTAPSSSSSSAGGGILAPVAAVVGSSFGFLLTLIIAAGLGFWMLARREARVAGVRV